MTSSVKFWSAVRLGGDSSGDDGSFYFDWETFVPAPNEEIPTYLRSRLIAAQNTPVPVPLVIIASVQDNAEWLPAVIHEAFPEQYSSVMPNVFDVNTWERGTANLPVVDTKAQNMSFLIQYPMQVKNKSTIKFCPVAALLYAAPPVSPSAPSPPVVFIACRDDEVALRLQEQCVSGNWKIGQLESTPSRIFLDLFSFLSDWSIVWRSARSQLTKINAELQSKSGSMEVLEQTRVIHLDTASIIAMREDLRLHVTAFQRFISLTKTLASRQSPLVGIGDGPAYLENRAEEYLQNLLHQQESSAVIQRQLENLLSLAFNIEMVSQGQAVARLNTLAFTFLPLSYVAALFGMTNLGISAKWYPLGAAIVLILVLLWFVVTARLPESLSKRLMGAFHRKPATLTESPQHYKPNDSDARPGHFSSPKPSGPTPGRVTIPGLGFVRRWLRAPRKRSNVQSDSLPEDVRMHTIDVIDVEECAIPRMSLDFPLYNLDHAPRPPGGRRLYSTPIPDEPSLLTERRSYRDNEVTPQPLLQLGVPEYSELSHSLFPPPILPPRRPHS